MTGPPPAEAGVVYGALDLRFTVRCDDRELDRHLRRILGPLAVRSSTATAAVPTAYQVTVHGPPDHPAQLHRDGVALVVSDVVAAPVAHLLHDLNHRAVEVSGARTVLHAAAVELAGRTVLLPAEMEAGKSTLTTALVRAGARYLTDELVALDEAGELEGLPRAVSLDPGSWPLFPDLRPPVASRVAPYLPLQWQVVLDDAPAPRRPGVDLIVLPRYTPGGGSTTQPIAPFEALRALLACCFTLDREPQRDLDALAAVAARAPAYTLATDDLDAACAAVERAAGRARGRPAPRTLTGRPAAGLVVDRGQGTPWIS